VPPPPATLSSRLAAAPSPLSAVAVPARLALGALSSLEDVPALAERLLSSASGSASPDALLGVLDAELAVLEERGAAAEGQLYGALPQPLAALVPPPPPGLAGGSVGPGRGAVGWGPFAEEEEESSQRRNPRATYSAGPPVVTARFAGGVADNRAGSEAEALLRELRAAREALAASRAPGAGSLKALAARTAAQRLHRHAAELQAEGTAWLDDVSQAGDAAAMRAVLAELQQVAQGLADATAESNN
jgi:hypothetical protein